MVLRRSAGAQDGRASVTGLTRPAPRRERDDQGRMERNDPYLILLRRELTRAQARLRRAERERDRAVAALERLQRASGKPSRRRPAKRARPTPA